MEKDKLKLELLEKIIKCDDAAVLKRIGEIFFGTDKLNEEGEEYGVTFKTNQSSDFNISPELEEELMERYEEHLQGKGKTYSWEEVKKDLEDSHGL